MPETFRVILLCLAFVLFLLAGFNVPTAPPTAPPRLSLGWLGLAALTAALWLR
jgi:hypothetical protein